MSIEIKTEYPNNYIYINFSPKGNLQVEKIRNGDTYKISNEDIQKYFKEILSIVDKKFVRIKYRRLMFINSYLCLENFRDVMEGVIDKLINNNDKFESNKLGSFGYLFGKTKNCRLKFIENCKNFPDKFEYISTNRYNKDDPTMLSWVDIKRKYKYLINLPGHTYCTKIYPMLFCKRLVFYSVSNLLFKWEEGLEPWVHYVPVKNDMSDLLEKYEWAESNEDKVKEIVENCYNYALTKMSPNIMKLKLVELVESKLE